MDGLRERTMVTTRNSPGNLASIRTRTRRAMRTRPRAAVLAVSAALMPWVWMQPALADPAANQLPTGGQVTAGTANISTSASKMQIDQATDKAILNWQTFSIGSSAWVNFSQPSASSIALNRVLGNNPSEIFGRLSANGQVFLSNPSGVLFAPSASVDVGSLFATSLSINDQDFLAGRYNFYNSGNAGSVVNQGTIIATSGYAALAGPQVRNDGIIIAQAGTVTLAAGNRVTLDMVGDGLSSVRIDASGDAGGGTVLVGGDFHGANPSVQNASMTYVSQDSTINADALTNGNGGKVVVWSDQVTRVFGSISARGGAQSGDGGFAETSSKGYLEITRTPDLAAKHGHGGTWLLDPESINITNAQLNITETPGIDGVTAETFVPATPNAVTTIDVANINAALNNGLNVTVNTASPGLVTPGDITVSSAISKTADGGNIDGSLLTLIANRDILVNNTIGSTTGTLGVVLTAIRDVSVTKAITTNGGVFTSTGGNFSNSGTGTITTGGGVVSLTFQKAVTLNKAIDAAAGTITIAANQGGIGTNDFTMAGTSSLTTSDTSVAAVAIT